MDNLRDIYANLIIPGEGDYIPDDGVCPACDRLVRGNPATERLLAARGLRTALFCRCQAYQPPRTPWEMRKEKGASHGNA